jgi:hypothetical protein
MKQGRRGEWSMERERRNGEGQGSREGERRNGTG